MEYNFYGDNRKTQYDERVPFSKFEQAQEHAEHLLTIWHCTTVRVVEPGDKDAVYVVFSHAKPRE